jgi:hypothetical protein
MQLCFTSASDYLQSIGPSISTSDPIRHYSTFPAGSKTRLGWAILLRDSYLDTTQLADRRFWELLPTLDDLRARVFVWRLTRGIARVQQVGMPLLPTVRCRAE